MAEDTLIAAIEEDARDQARRILEDARQAAGAMLEEAAAEAAREKEERVRALERRLAGQRAAFLNDARMRASGERLAVRRSLMDRAVEEAEKRFAGLSGDGYAPFVRQLYGELNGEWENRRPGESPVVLVNPADKGLLDSGIKVVGDDGVRLGVVFVSPDGAVRFENTVAARLERARSAMEPAMNEMLFDEVFS